MSLDFGCNLEVDIKPSLEDKDGGAEGLCGDFDGDQGNDRSIPDWCSLSDTNLCWE
mgnify:CR=1 FL=1